MLGVAAGGTSYYSVSKKATGYSFDIVDLDAGAISRVTTSFLGHGFAPCPRAPRRAALFEKKGPGGCFVDLVTCEVLATIPPSAPNRAFYGHGAFSADSSALYAVETRLDTRAGLVSIRDGETFAVLGEMPTFGQSPHDLLLLDEGKTMALTNGGGALGSTDMPSVTFLDVASGKLLEKLPITEPRINAGHVAITASREIALVSAPREGLPEETSTGGVSLKGGDRLVTLKKPPAVVRKMLGEALSVCIDERSGVVVATHPRGGMVTFWSLADKRLIKVWETPSPRGVTLSRDGSCFVFGCGLAAGVTLVSTSTLEPIDREYGTSIFSGSHVYLWDRDAALRTPNKIGPSQVSEPQAAQGATTKAY